MRRSTIIGCFISLLSLTMTAQVANPSTSKTDPGTEVVKKSTPSLQELLKRYAEVGNQSGSIFENFNKDEQQVLRSYFNNQKPQRPASPIKGLSNSSAEAMQLTISAADRDTYKNKYTPLFVAPALKDHSEAARMLTVSAENRSAYKQSKPLFLSTVALMTPEEANILALAQRSENASIENNPINQYGRFFYTGTTQTSNSTIYGAKGLGVENQQSSASIVELLARQSQNENQPGLGYQAFTQFEREVLEAYQRAQNSSNRGPQALLLEEGFEDVTTLPGNGFTFVNASDVPNLGWNQGAGAATFPAYEGLEDEYISVNYNSTSGSTINNWMIAPVLNLENGDEITFWSRTMTGSTFADRLEVRLDPTGVNTNPAGPASVGSYTELLLEINPGLTIGGYPEVWTQYTATVSGLTGAVDTRVAFRYWVTDGGPFGNNSNYIGIDSLSIEEGTGGGGATCSQDHPFSAVPGAGIGSSVNSDYKTASDIVVAAGEDFTLDTIEVPFLTLAPNDPPTTANIVYYADAGGLPGAMIGNESVVPTILSSAPWANPVAIQFMTSLPITPFTFPGDASVDTKYWIEISMGTATNQATVFWEGTIDTPVEGVAAAQYNALVGTWTVPNPAQEAIYTYSGICEPIGGGGGGILDTAYGINNGNFELIGFPVSDPSTVEVFGDSPVTSNFENAGAIDPANPRTGYVLDNAGQFYSFDVESGFYTLLGNISGDWVGMEFDQATGVLYAIAGASLYTIDPVAVTATLVGATGINPADIPIALAIDGAGVGYTYELVTDNLYSIDLSTGTATLIGNIGFDANYGQGMCYDALTDTIYMAAFNSATFTAEWRSVNKTTGATTLVGPIVTTAITTQVAWVSIGETLPPPACPEPTNLVVTNITPTSADLSWSTEPNATSGYIWYVFDQGANPVTDTPVATGTTPTGTTTATATGLGGGFNYDFYVVADCTADGLSQYAGPITFATPPACGGKFYDTGGPGGDYENSANVTTVISPENAGEQVTVTFTAFDVEEAWDALYVYDGPDTSSPLISSGNPQTNGGFPAGGYYGTTIPGPFVSSHATGALTFVFLSDGSVPYPGWEADVTCALLPPPNDMIVNSIDVDEVGFPYTDPAVRMPAATTEDGNPENCDITGANGVWYNFVSAGDGTANATIVTPGGASSVTFYTAPDENAVETDLVLVDQNSNQCVPGTSASIFTLAGQAYYVFVLNNGAITDIVIDGTNLGIADNTIEGFSYYPNPTTGILNLNSVENIEHVSIYNVLGQRVMDSRVDATTTHVDISALSAGTYLMKVIVNGQTGTYRVLKN